MLRVIAGLVAIAFAAVVVVVALALRQDLPTTMAGMAAQGACSGALMAGRDPTRVVSDDLWPASPLMRLVDLRVDAARGVVVASMPGSTRRVSIHDAVRGCVLLGPGAKPGADGPRPTPAQPAAPLRDAPWPEGDRPLDRTQWPAQVDAAALEAVVDGAFDGSAASGTRSVVVVHRGRMLIDRYASGFDARTPQSGWSMSEGVLGLLVWRRLGELGVAPDTPVVALPQARPPHWLADWRTDGRRTITMRQLLTMRDGLAFDNSEDPWGEVPKMLWSEPDIAGWAGRHALSARPGAAFRYASAVPNLLAGVLRAQFVDDAAYWRYPEQALFGPIGARSARFETDAAGNLVGSSYLWATTPDWARIGWLMASDGRWGDRQVLPPGWLAFATQVPGAPDATYGAQVWLATARQRAGCPATTRLPADAIWLLGRWGQSMLIVPSLQTVVVRTGLSVGTGQWSPCAFAARVLAALGGAGAAG